MKNYLNYIIHKTYNPGFSQRNWEHDLPNEVPSYAEVAKRATTLALPFLTLYQPFAHSLSIGIETCRCLSSLSEAGLAAHDKNIQKCLLQIAHTSIVTANLAGHLFHFQTGLLIRTSTELLEQLYRLIQDLPNRDREKILYSLIQITASSLYLAILYTGSLEVIFVSLILQGLIQLHQAHSEYKQQHWPEVIAKMAMGTIRFRQAHHHIHIIQQRNHLRTLAKFAKLFQYVQKGREIDHLIDSSLHTPPEEVVLLNADGTPYRFGSHVHGNGKHLVKEMNLTWKTQQKNGHTIKEIDFKINHVFRDQLQQFLNELSTFSPTELSDFLHICQSHAKGIQIETAPFQLSNQTNITIESAYKVTLVGLGSIFVGQTPNCPTLYDQIRVEIDEEKNLYDLHELLAFFHLDDAFRPSSSEDLERLKIGHLFRTFYPKEATLLERDEKFFSLPLQHLKNTIIEQIPAMKELFDMYLSRVKPYEILPGRIRYGIEGLSREAFQRNARALLATITGANDDASLFHRLASILKMGMLASEVRYKNGIVSQGLSCSGIDFFTGGADSVFTQLLTEKNFREQLDLQQLFYQGKIRVLFSLDVLNTGTYQYHNDSFGWRGFQGSSEEMQLYLERPNLFEFIKHEQLCFHQDNEVMIKERIPPSMIQGIIVDNKETQSALLNYLRQKGLVEKTVDQQERILNIPLDRFIHVGKQLSDTFLKTYTEKG